MTFTFSTFSVPIDEAGLINGIAETLEATDPRANTKNNVLIKLEPPTAQPISKP
jgi:hypothetical protein